MSEITRRYAKALHEVGVGDEALRTAISVITEDANLRAALEHPTIPSNQKMEVLKKLPIINQNPHLLRFFSLLFEKGRFSLLSEIMTDFHNLTLHQNATKPCTVTCVKAPSDAQLQQLKTVLCPLHHVNDIEFTINLDPSLIDGFVLEIDGVEYDHSVRHRLSDLSRYLKEVKTL